MIHFTKALFLRSSGKK